MGIWDVITDIVEAASPWSVAEAEAVAAPAAESAQEEVRYPVELEGGALQLHAGLFEGGGGSFEELYQTVETCLLMPIDVFTG